MRTSSILQQEKAMGADHYIGPERRIEARRINSDRRQAIRFEPNKTPRRSGKDRRINMKGIWDGREDF
ncbi:MAG: hypothetical protein OEY00_10590 [Gammaproteobacteria bacterium]|nr:hypothetical protein [Gammaproteobacteria bacterium]